MPSLEEVRNGQSFDFISILACRSNHCCQTEQENLKVCFCLVWETFLCTFSKVTCIVPFTRVRNIYLNLFNPKLLIIGIQYRPAVNSYPLGARRKQERNCDPEEHFGVTMPPTRAIPGVVQFIHYPYFRAMPKVRVQPYYVNPLCSLSIKTHGWYKQALT